MKHFNDKFTHVTTLDILERISNGIIPPAKRKLFPNFPFSNMHRLLDYRFDYETLSVSDACDLRQFHALYSKLESLDVGIDKEAVAFEKFIECEQKCQETNALFRNRTAGLLSFRPDVEEQLFAAQQKIRVILGNVPRLETLHLRYGPGATTSIKKQDASVTHKLSAELACSEDLSRYVGEVLYELPHLIPAEEEVSTVDVAIHRARLSFVPKNARTYRSVCVEPTLNGMVQLGIGRFLQGRLKRFGLDISQQQPNQLLAREGSLTGELATLDLSSASDLISTELVRFLLPVDWFCFLNRYRTQTCVYDCPQYTAEIVQDKFCSMGNGFTFPLETLIFYALTSAVDPSRKVRAYGDDIICTVKKYSDVVHILEVCGFSVNLEKSYTSSEFRESCGADYLSGIDIRPIYIKEDLTVSGLFRLHNLFLKNYPHVSHLIFDMIPPHIRLVGPYGAGHGHLWMRGGWGRPYKRELGWAGVLYDTYSTSPKLDLNLRPGDRILPAYSIYVSDPSNEDATRGLPVLKGNPRATFPSSPWYKRISVYTLDLPK